MQEDLLILRKESSVSSSTGSTSSEFPEESAQELLENVFQWFKENNIERGDPE